MQQRSATDSEAAYLWVDESDDVERHPACLQHHSVVRLIIIKHRLQSGPGWLGSPVVSVLDSGAEGPGLNRSRDAVG